MADFCRDCMPDSTDFVGLTDTDSWKDGRAALVLCEGCGAIQVDPDGYCLGYCQPYESPGKPHACRHCTLVRIFGGIQPDATRVCHFHGEGEGDETDD
jgi:hypothetical protein